MVWHLALKLASLFVGEFLPLLNQVRGWKATVLPSIWFLFLLLLGRRFGFRCPLGLALGTLDGQLVDLLRRLFLPVLVLVVGIRNLVGGLGAAVLLLLHLLIRGCFFSAAASTAGSATSATPSGLAFASRAAWPLASLPTQVQRGHRRSEPQNGAGAGLALGNTRAAVGGVDGLRRAVLRRTIIVISCP